jgi:hypothetical protein
MVDSYRRIRIGGGAAIQMTASGGSYYVAGIDATFSKTTVSEEATALETFANNTTAGTTAQFPCSDLAVLHSGSYVFDPPQAAVAANIGAVHMLNWSSMWDYDSVTKRWFTSGGRPYQSTLPTKLVWYDETTNTWGTADQWSGHVCGHLYRSTTVMTSQRKVAYWAHGDNNVIDLWNIDTNQYAGTLPAPQQPIGGFSNSWLGHMFLCWFPTMGAAGSLIHVNSSRDRIVKYDMVTQVWTAVGNFDGLWTNQHIAGHYHPLTDKMIVGSSDFDDQKALAIISPDGSLSLTAVAPCTVACNSTSQFIPHPTRRASIVIDRETKRRWQYEWDTNTWVDLGALPASIDNGNQSAFTTATGVMVVQYGAAGTSKMFFWKPADVVEIVEDPETAFGHFRSVTLLEQISQPVDSMPADTPLRLVLHDDGEWETGSGRQLYARVDTSLSSVDNEPFRFMLQFDGEEFQIYPHAGLNMPSGESTGPVGNWWGYSTNTGAAYDYQLRRIEQLMAWCDANYPAASYTKRVIEGRGIGAASAINYASRRPGTFAAVFASRPNWRYGPTFGSFVLYDRLLDAEVTYLTGETPPVDGFSGTYETHSDMISYAESSFNKMPFVAWCAGKNDANVQWQDQLDAVEAMRNNRRGFVFAWNSGDETTGDILSSTVIPALAGISFDSGVGYPVFSNSSLDDDPNIDSSGGINLGHIWRNVVETADSWSCEVSHLYGAATVDVIPYSEVFTHTVQPISVSMAQNEWVPVVFELQVPNQFTFNDVTGAELSTQVESNVITVTGISSAVTISVVNGAYSVNGGAYTSSPGTVVSGNQVKVRVTSSSSYSTANNCSLSIGPTSDTFTVTTKAYVSGPVPEGLNVLTLENVSRNSYVTVRYMRAALNSTYDRFQTCQIVSGASAVLNLYNFSANTYIALGSSQYNLLIDGVQVATVTIPQPGITRTAQFTFNSTTIANGWRRVNISGLAPGETNPTWFIYVQNGATVTPSEWVPVSTAPHGWTHAQRPYYWAKVSPTPSPRTYLYPHRTRTYEYFSTALARSSLHCGQLVPIRNEGTSDVHRINKTSEGVISRFDMQPYFKGDMFKRYPLFALLDGPRGVGTVAFVTHLAIGTADPNGVIRGNVYFTDPWRMGKISQDGVITTLAGWRHKEGIIDYWDDIDQTSSTPPQQLELVGDWSAIPAARRGFHELWGIAWNAATTVIDTNAAPIPSENNEQPHITGPQAFVTDSQWNRICKLQFIATAHGVPPVVTEFITNMGDPWALAYYEGTLIVSERSLSRISQWDVNTGAYIRTLVSGPTNLTYTIGDGTRRVYPNAGNTVAAHQALQVYDCVNPEGVVVQDEWVYYGSQVQKQIRRVNIDTGAVEVVWTQPTSFSYTSSQTLFYNISISDGTFGPKGTVFLSTWDQWSSSHPYAILPGGANWAFSKASNANDKGQWPEDSVYGGRTTLGYPSASGVAFGRLVFGGSDEGICVVSKAQPGDTVAPSAVWPGQTEWYQGGYDLVYGNTGFGFYDLDLPWGVSANIDAYLQWHGHSQT